MNISEVPRIPPVPWHVSTGEKAIWDVSDPFGYHREWRHDIFSKIPDSLGERLAEIYKRDYIQSSARKANTRLRRATSPLLDSGLPILADEDQLIHQSKLKSYMCRRMVRQQGESKDIYAVLSLYAERSGVEAIKISSVISRSGAVKRYCSEKWWRRQLRKQQRVAIETGAIYAGNVHSKANVYVSDENLERQRQYHQRIRNVLESLLAVNELGDSYTLLELSELSVSNPVIRRSELMTRLAGYELYAEQEGYVPYFLTLTCPSRFHARYGKTGQENPAYDQSTPKQAHAYLNKVWTRIRSRWLYYDVMPFGVRIAEPHHDGTPHWHILIFVKLGQENKCLEIFRKYALMDSPDEAGASSSRIKVEKIDRAKGTAVGYVAKYISKNVDGYGLDFDDLGNEAISSSERVRVWARTWSIRQFQDFGGPPVTVWRELRKKHSIITESDELERARLAADSGNWCDFLYAMGGVSVSRKDRCITLAKVWSDKPNVYGEPTGEIIFGVKIGDVEIKTRIHIWEIQHNAIAIGSEESENEPYSIGKVNEEFCLYPIGFPENSDRRSDCCYLEFCQ